MCSWPSALTITLTIILSFGFSTESFDYNTKVHEAFVKAGHTISLLNNGTEKHQARIDYGQQLFQLQNVLTSEKLIDHLYTYIQESIQDTSSNISTVCLNQTMQLIEGLATNKSWTYQFVDATCKPPPGVSQGALVWTGSYSMCTSIIVPPKIVSGQVVIPSHSGRYCQAVVGTQLRQLGGQPVSFNLGVCIPDSCTTADLIDMLEAVSDIIESVEKKPHNVSFDLSYCHETWGSISLSPGAIIMTVIVYLLMVLVMCGTGLELWLHYGEEDVSNKSASKSKPRNGVINNGLSAVEEVSETDSSRANGRVTPTNYIPTENEIDRAEDQNDESDTVAVLGSNNSSMSNGNIKNKQSSNTSSKPKLQIWRKLLLSFSLVTNVSKLMNTTDNPNAGTLGCVHGIRFISLSWVILGHTLVFAAGTSNNVLSFMITSVNNWTFGAIANATVSVDSFFVLSGLLTAYIFYREMDKPSGPFSTWKGWVIFYIHRYWRLTPAYMLVLGLETTLFRYVWDGPVYPQQNGIELNCPTTWWTNLLYINNIVKSKEMCMGWSWYLANDMQFYVLSPVFMLTMYYTKIGGFILHALVLILSMIATGVISEENNVGAGLNGMGLSFDNIYVKPYTRIGPYIIGLAAGYLLYKTKCKPNLHKAVVFAGWFLATVLGLTVMYSLTNVMNGKTILSYDVAALFNCTNRVAWAFALAWVIFACCTGYGGWVDRFLSWKALIPLSRLTYCAYLVHPVVIFFGYYSMETAVVMNNSVAAFAFCSFMLSSYAVAFITSMMVEAPMLGLERVLRGR